MMKNKIMFVLAAVMTMFCLTGCNRQIVDTTFSYDKAIISLPNEEVVEGKVQSWKDYEGEQIQVKVDGITYLVHAENICLIND